MTLKNKDSYFSINYLKYLLLQMNKYPVSYLLYSIPSILLILLITTLLEFLNFINREFTTVTNPQELVIEFNSYIFFISLYLITYYIADTMVAHFSYTQFKYNSNLLKTFSKAYKRYFNYLIHRLLQFSFVSLPLVGAVLVVLFISDIFNSFFVLNQTSQLIIVFFLILIAVILISSLILSGLLSLKYAYLAVSTQFSTSKKFFKIKEYHHNVEGHFKSIAIRILILVALIFFFRLIKIIYDYLTSFVGIDTLQLGLQVVGVLLSMFVFYFVNTYLFFSYKDEFNKKSITDTKNR